MKKIIILLLVASMLLTGCGKSINPKRVINQFIKQYDKSSGYRLKGNLSIHNNDDVYHYDIEVCYQKENHYKVVLKNTSNQHTQIILKNDDGVYVLTPAFNKSFKFQSDWPYQNSQIYLIDAIIHDIKNDKDVRIRAKDDYYVVQSSVLYPNNSKLKKQKIIFDNHSNLKKVVVYDENGIDCMTMNFDKIEFSPKLSSNDFKIDNIMDSSREEVEETGSLDDIIYPLFLPEGTKLVDEENVPKENGKRVIMNYDGEKSFLLVEETTDVFQDLTIIPSVGEPLLLMGTMGVQTDNSLSWSSGGVDFYLVSDVMSMDEMIEVAQSLGTVTSMK